jgi:DNA-binding SARP family transcriptional activator
LSDLILAFLGSPRITRPQIGEITFPKRKALALFAYLVTESDHPHSRESLLGLLGPNCPPLPLRTTCASPGRNCASI